MHTEYHNTSSDIDETNNTSNPVVLFEEAKLAEYENAPKRLKKQPTPKKKLTAIIESDNEVSSQTQMSHQLD